MSESTTEPAQAPRRDSVGAGDSAESVSLACLPYASYHYSKRLVSGAPGRVQTAATVSHWLTAAEGCWRRGCAPLRVH